MAEKTSDLSTQNTQSGSNDTWLDSALYEDVGQQDRLEAKNWELSTRESDDSTSQGNIHIGDNTETDNISTLAPDNTFDYQPPDISIVPLAIVTEEQSSLAENDSPLEAQSEEQKTQQSPSQPLSSAQPTQSTIVAPLVTEANDQQTDEQSVHSNNQDSVTTNIEPTTKQNIDGSNEPKTEGTLLAAEEPVPAVNLEASVASIRISQTDIVIDNVKSDASQPEISDEKVAEAITISQQPAVIEGSGGEVAEDTAITTTGNLSITDKNQGENYFIADSFEGTYGSFEIAPDGSWTYALANEQHNVQSLAEGQQVTDSFTITSADGTQHSIAMTINGTNDNVSISADIDTQDNAILETIDNGEIVHLTTSASDPDNETVIYSLVDDNGQHVTDGPFAIDAATGVVTVADKSQIDYETADSHTLHVQAESTDGSTSTTDFQVQVGDVEVVKVTDLGGDENGTPVTFTLSGHHHDPANTDDPLAGAPKFTILVNGEQLTIEGQSVFTVEANQGHLVATASDKTGDGINDLRLVNDANDIELFSFKVPKDIDIEAVSISFINDAYDGSNADLDQDNIVGEDRNLVVKELNIGGILQDDNTLAGGTLYQAEDKDYSQYMAGDKDVSGRETMAWSGTMTFYPEGVPLAESVELNDDVTNIVEAGNENTAQPNTAYGNVLTNDNGSLSVSGVENGITVNTSSNDGVLKVDSTGDNPDLLGGATSLDITLEVSSSDSSTNTALLSYATDSKDNELLIYNSANGSLSLYVNGQNVSTSISSSEIYDGERHSFNVKWNSEDGVAEFQLDGETKGTATIAQGYTIGNDGTLMFGQEQDRNGEALDSGQIFSGTYHGIAITTNGEEKANWQSFDITEGKITDTSENFTLEVSGDAVANQQSISTDTIIEGQFGTLTLNADGSYAYALNDAHPQVQALHNGESLAENFSLSIQNEQTEHIGTENLVFTINGTNDAPVATSDIQFITEADIQVNTTQKSGALILDSRGDNPDLLGGATSIDMSLDVTSSDVGTNTALFSYATDDQHNEFLVYNSSNGVLNLYIDGTNVSTSISSSEIYDGEQHTFNVKWNSEDGVAEFQLDGETKGTATIGQGHTIRENGTLMFGQEQDTNSGALDTNQIFSGTYHNIAIATNGEEKANWDMNTIANGQIIDSTGSYDLTITGDYERVIIQSEPISSDEDTAITINVEDLLLHASDVEGDTLSVSEVAMNDDSAHYGSVDFNEDGNIVFTPAKSLNALATGETQEVRFSYTVDDGHGGTATAEQTIVVTGINDSPDAGVVQLGTTVEDGSIVFSKKDLLAQSSDIEGDVVSIVGTISSDPEHGVVTENPDGTFTFTPHENFSGSDLPITYTLSDGQQETAATASITVEAVADTPTLEVHIGAAMGGGKEHDYTDMEGFDTLKTLGIDSSYLTPEDTQLATITFMGETAGYKNTVGTYLVDPDGQIVDVNLAWDNASQGGSELTAGEDSINFIVPAGYTVGVFMAANAFNNQANRNTYNNDNNGSYAFVNEDGTGATVESDSPQLVYTDQNGDQSVINSPIYHITPEEEHLGLNSDNVVHIRSGVNENDDIQIGFEDLPMASADKDFQDLNLAITFDPITTYDLNIETNLTDKDGSESLHITIDGIPEGCGLSAGTVDATGAWTLTTDQLEGLTLYTNPDKSMDFALEVTATATEEDNNDTISVSQTIQVNVEDSSSYVETATEQESDTFSLTTESIGLVPSIDPDAQSESDEADTAKSEKTSEESVITDEQQVSTLSTPSLDAFSTANDNPIENDMDMPAMDEETDAAETSQTEADGIGLSPDDAVTVEIEPETVETETLIAA